MQKEGSCCSIVLPGQSSARKKWCRKPGTRNIFRHERRPPATGRIQNCITGKEQSIKVPVKQTAEKDLAWIQNSSAGERW
ncbi:mCG141321 [Mus musculus]|nr:mCG141321 [Mus musculus]